MTEIFYKSGYENKVADGLSRQELDNPAMISALSTMQTCCLVALKKVWETDPEFQPIIIYLFVDRLSHKGYLWQHGLLTYKERWLDHLMTTLKV